MMGAVMQESFLLPIKKSNNKSKKMKVLNELLLLTKEKCLLSLEEKNKNDSMSYHHLHKRQKGGPKTFDNGAPLLRSCHDFLNIIEEKDNSLYEEINCALDCMKEAILMNDVLCKLYSEDYRMTKTDHLLDEDLNNLNDVDFEEIDETIGVKFLSIEQLIEVKKALKIYEEEVIQHL